MVSASVSGSVEVPPAVGLPEQSELVYIWTVIGTSADASGSAARRRAFAIDDMVAITFVAGI